MADYRREDYEAAVDKRAYLDTLTIGRRHPPADLGHWRMENGRWRDVKTGKVGRAALTFKGDGK